MRWFDALRFWRAGPCLLTSGLRVETSPFMLLKAGLLVSIDSKDAAECTARGADTEAWAQGAGLDSWAAGPAPAAWAGGGAMLAAIIRAVEALKGGLALFVLDLV